jgi:hypothetical protein
MSFNTGGLMQLVCGNSNWDFYGDSYPKCILCNNDYLEEDFYDMFDFGDNTYDFFKDKVIDDEIVYHEKCEKTYFNSLNKRLNKEIGSIVLQKIFGKYEIMIIEINQLTVENLLNKYRNSLNKVLFKDLSNLIIDILLDK